MDESRSEMVARLEREVRGMQPNVFVWSNPGPVWLERALGELGFDWNELEDIPRQHAHLGIPIREYPKTDLLYARAQELKNAAEREEEVESHHLHSWAVKAQLEEDMWGDTAMWLNVRHIPDPVSYYLHEREWREFVADVERAIASPGDRFVGGKLKNYNPDSGQASES